MIDPKDSQAISVSCFGGQAPYLRRELEGLGMPILGEGLTTVETRGTLDDAQRLNFHLRTALHVLILLKELNCKDADELYREARKLSWERLVPPDGYLTVTSRVDTPAIRNSMFASQRLKDAVVDRILEKTGRRPDSGSEKKGVVLSLFCKVDRAWIYFNSNGQKLADRGYRKMPHAAPLRETLAAALLMEAGYDGSCPVLFPMCGSGTLPIEAALIATGRAPGFCRNAFSFMHIQGFDAEAWKSLRREWSLSKREPAFAIHASDIDPAAIDAARKNARTAGVEELIDWQVCDFAAMPIPETPGKILLNPEYGERLGGETELAALYKRIGDWFKQSCGGWEGFLFTGNKALAKTVGLRPSRRVPFWNGMIECRLLRYEIYAGSRKGEARAEAPDGGE
ncbi:MAG: class I SAM-dependent RNA methyltransferase [Planctomycetes bacterium]|nr:class I SAM-dependent RNA methyltransferase [Planctomycetota bacterium]